MEPAEEQEAKEEDGSKVIATTVEFGGIQPLNAESQVVEDIMEEDRIMEDKPVDKDTTPLDTDRDSALYVGIRIMWCLSVRRE